MRKWVSILLSLLLCAAVLAGCDSSGGFQDGTYEAIVSGYDSNGYKDFVRLTVKDGVVTDLVYDGVNEEGNLRTDNQELAKKMEQVQGTYPEKYTTDLVNQYLSEQDIQKVDAVAGATNATNNFFALLNALEPNMRSGDTTPLVVESVPEK